MIYEPSFTKIGAGVQVMLRFGFRYFGGCNVGILIRIYAFQMGPGE
jgi:hypothetical protein